jgi:asparagine synthase (glutamine-hydrolysing)
MCGIAGVIADLAPDVLARIVREMGRWLVHRGPDEWGEYVAPGVGFGHTRLAILDLEGGQQPMMTVDRSIVIAFNGEIYNFKDLRSTLAAKGHRFSTDHSDTEVILHGYKEWGASVVKYLEGMFAFALWDQSRQFCMLARDRVGIKPLYYAVIPGGLLFASEPKAIVRSGLLDVQFDENQLANYFTFRAPLHPHTLWKGVRKLPPGHWLGHRQSSGVDGPTTYWLASRREAPPMTLDDAVQEVTERLDRAVRMQLVADVPVGVFFSGGVDSSLIASMASKYSDVPTFTIGTHSDLDESGLAISVAQRLGLSSKVHFLNPLEYLAEFENWAYFNDDPASDPSALALMILARFARGFGMKVMLAGEGGDELFGGYNSYRRFYVLRTLGFIPGVPWVAALVGRHPDSRTGDYLCALQRREFLGTAHMTTVRKRRSLLIGESGDQIPLTSGPGATLRDAMIFDQNFRLPDDILARTDRATMAVSLEGRVPFLDTSVIDLANALTNTQCLDPLRLSGKRVLKKALEKRLPRSFVSRSKRGFDLPLAKWLAEDFRPMALEVIAEKKIEQLNYPYLRQEYARCCAGEREAIPMLWAWLVLERWYRLWVCGRGEARGPADIVGASPTQAVLERVASVS